MRYVKDSDVADMLSYLKLLKTEFDGIEFEISMSDEVVSYRAWLFGTAFYANHDKGNSHCSYPGKHSQRLQMAGKDSFVSIVTCFRVQFSRFLEKHLSNWNCSAMIINGRVSPNALGDT